MELSSMAMRVPIGVHNIIRRLQSSGFQTFLVGGCVRDLIQGKEPADFDLVTSAEPEETESLFHSVLDVGKRFGTVMVQHEGISAEVTTMRREDDYRDARRPDTVFFHKSLSDDMLRRDFTINALAFDGTKLFDFTSGLRDLHLKTIRCVGDPDRRFAEDGLRLMRAIRLAAELDFSIDSKTWDSVVNLAEIICRVSRERIRKEMERILLCDHPSVGLALLSASGILQLIIQVPELENVTLKSVDWGLVDQMEKVMVTRLAVFLLLLFGMDCILSEGFTHGGKEPIRGLLTKLSFPKRIVTPVVNLLSEVPRLPCFKDSDARRIVNRIGREAASQNFGFFSAAGALLGYPSEVTAGWVSKIQQTLLNDEPVGISDLAVTGHDLIEQGWVQGPAVKSALEYLLEMVLDDPEMNKKSVLLAHARRMMIME